MGDLLSALATSESPPAEPTTPEPLTPAAPPTPATSPAAPMTPAAADAEIARIRADRRHPFNNRDHRDHEHALRQMQQLYGVKNGTPTPEPGVVLSEPVAATPDSDTLNHDDVARTHYPALSNGMHELMRRRAVPYCARQGGARRHLGSGGLT